MEVESESTVDTPNEGVEDDAGSISADGSSDSGGCGGVATDDIRLQDSEEQAPLNGAVSSSSSSTPSTPDVDSSPLSRCRRIPWTSGGAKRTSMSPAVWGHGGGGGGGTSRCKLLSEGDIQLCRLNHTRTIVSKIMNSKYLRRWESHHLLLDNCEIRSNTPYGFMESPIPYWHIEDVNVISRWDAGQRFCIRITIPDGSVLLQARNYYIRDQWLHSIQWKVDTLHSFFSVQ